MALDAGLPPGKQQTLFDELTTGTSAGPVLVLLAYAHVHGVRVRAGPTLRRRRVQHEEHVVSR